MTRIRQWLEADVFQRFVERIGDLCQEAGLVWGRELYVDATKTDFRMSLTDPDATPMRTGTRTTLRYHDHDVVDEGKQRIILAALVTPADVMENVPLRDLLRRVCFRRRPRPF